MVEMTTCGASGWLDTVIDEPCYNDDAPGWACSTKSKCRFAMTSEELQASIKAYGMGSGSTQLSVTCTGGAPTTPTTTTTTTATTTTTTTTTTTEPLPGHDDLGHGEIATQDCPDGTVSIRTAPVCEVAANAIGLDYMGPQNTND
jgi:hypothetical protein